MICCLARHPRPCVIGQGLTHVQIHVRPMSLYGISDFLCQFLDFPFRFGAHFLSLCTYSLSSPLMFSGPLNHSSYKLMLLNLSDVGV